VLQLPVLLTLVLAILSLASFLFVVEHIGKELRPVTVVTKVAREGLAVIRNTYPLLLSPDALPPRTGSAFLPRKNAGRWVNHQGRARVILAFNVRGLVDLAKRNECLIELVPQIGDFVGAGSPLFRIYGGGSGVRDRELIASVALGAERTMEQDPAFAFRIIVDIADKALSPAINDPTTSVLSIDQIQFLLQEVGKRDLDTGTVCDEGGEVRLVYRTPAWEDFVLLGITEIRHFGANSIQVMRRLCAMLEHLIEILPAERVPLLEQQRDLIHASVDRKFKDPLDRVRAEIPDFQGLGGRSRT
jgi:uncharacterized membrane protein